MSSWPQLLGKVFGLAFAIYVTVAFGHWFLPHVRAREWGVIALAYGGIFLFAYAIAGRADRQEAKADGRRAWRRGVTRWQAAVRRVRAYWQSA